MTGEEVPQQALGKSTAQCRGCGRFIAQLRGGYWLDANGFMLCAKVRLGDIGHGQQPSYIFHAPMPDGLRGAPS